MTYYIDGMDVPFHSMLEIREFLLSLRRPCMLYQFIDRYIYYGDVHTNTYLCVAVIQIPHFSGNDRMCYQVDIVLTRDRMPYFSVLTSCPLNRSFSRFSCGCPKSTAKRSKNSRKGAFAPFFILPSWISFSRVRKGISFP